MKIISFIIRKGGSGKTTTAVNTAAGLALAGKKVLLIDLDPQENATKLSGMIDISNNNYNRLYDKNICNLIYESDLNTIQTMYKTSYNYDILPSHDQLKDGAVSLLMSGNTTFLKNKIDQIDKNLYDYILIDTPPEEGILSINALFASDFVIIPMQTDDDARRAVAATIKMIENTRKNKISNVKLLGILPTIYYGVASISRIILKEAIESFQGNIIKGIVINHTKWFKEASRYGKPLYFVDKEAYYKSQYQDFVEFIIKEAEK